MNKNETMSKLVQASALLAAIGEERSFTKAAERLNVHQSAVSHRTKALEIALGYALFERTTRHFGLTEAGDILCSAAIDAMATWDTALAKLERGRTSNSVQLSLPSSLAMKWLIPILPSSHAMDLDISVDVKEEMIDFATNEADAAIRFGQGPYPGLHSSHLAHCNLQPVASPAYLKRLPSEASVLECASTVFLSDRRGKTDNTDFSWDHYFAATGYVGGDFDPDFQFDRADLMLQAAISGMGVGLGRTLLIENDIKARFLKPVGPPVPMKSGYWLVCSASFAGTNKHERLLVWLKSELQRATDSAKLPSARLKHQGTPSKITGKTMIGVGASRKPRDGRCIEKLGTDNP